MNFLIEMAAGSWVVLGMVKTIILALAGALFIVWIRQCDLAARLWACLTLLMPVAFFSGILPLSWNALPLVGTSAAEFQDFQAASILEGEDTAQAPVMVRENIVPVEVEPSPAQPRAAAPSAELVEPVLSRDQWLGLLWIVVGAITLVPGLFSLMASRRLRRSVPDEEIVNLWREVAGEWAAKVPVRLSPDVTTPGISAIFRPEVILPETAIEWEREQLISVLRHEFHHLRQADPVLRWLGRLARALLWFHPAAWWIQSRLVAAQERAADDAVTAAGTPSAEYAGHLLAVASGRQTFPGIAMARPSQLGRRIRLVLSGRGVTRCRAAFERGIASALGVLGFLTVLVGFGNPETARGQVAEAIDDTGFRGPILDRNGVLLATSNPARMPEALQGDPPARWYPRGETFAHVTGFLGRVPQANAWMEATPSLAEEKPLKLTLDVRIQRLAAEALEARGLPGGLLVMDPHSGEVLAMASWPVFNPNELTGGMNRGAWKTVVDDDRKPFLSRTALPIVPGSFAKLVTALAAAKADKADRVIHCGPSVKLGSLSLRDWNTNRNEKLDLRSALATSCNTYFIPLAGELGGGALDSIGKDFGFGAAHPVFGSGRSRWPARINPENELSKGDIAMTAIGQGATRLTMIEMSRVMSAVASGRIQSARFTDSDPPGDSVALADLGIDGGELETIRAGLIDLVNSPGGVGRRARIEGKTVAGISATGQNGIREYAASFTGYAPADRPRFVVSAVFFTDPGRSGVEPLSGGSTAGPVVAGLMKALLDESY